MKISRLFIIPTFLLFTSSPVLAEEYCSEKLCIVTSGENSVNFSSRNMFPGSVTVKVVITESENMSLKQGYTFVKVIKGTSNDKLFTLSQLNKRKIYSYRFRYFYYLGSKDAVHNDNYLYSLPYAKNSSFLLSQGPNGKFSHQGHFAFDFIMPEGTPVHAARGGLVIATEDTFNIGGVSEDYKNKANYVFIEHDDGTIGRYYHLMHSGVAVKPGDFVKTSEIIGYSGNTGYSSRPHLHFEVTRTTEKTSRNTVDISFKGKPSVKGSRKGNSITLSNDGKFNSIKLREGSYYISE